MLKESGAKLGAHRIRLNLSYLCKNSNSKPFLDELLRLKANLNYRYYRPDCHVGNGTALHVAAANLNYSFVKILLEAKADPFARNKNGKTYHDEFRIEKLRRIACAKALKARIAARKEKEKELQLANLELDMLLEDFSPEKRARHTQ